VNTVQVTLNYCQTVIIMRMLMHRYGIRNPRFFILECKHNGQWSDWCYTYLYLLSLGTSCDWLHLGVVLYVTLLRRVNGPLAHKRNSTIPLKVLH